MGACPCAATGKEEYDIFFTTGDHLAGLIKKDFDELFDKMDKNHDGNLDKKEIEGLLKEITAKGVILSTKTPAEVIKKVDANNDGKIQRQEFQDWIQAECLTKRTNLLNFLNKSPDTAWLEAITERAFKEVDKDGSGSIDLEEMITYLAEVSEQLGEEPYTREQVAKILDLADSNKDKKLSKVEFRTTMKAVIVKLYFYHGNKEQAAAASS